MNYLILIECTYILYYLCFHFATLLYIYFFSTLKNTQRKFFRFIYFLWLSPRFISIGQLNTLLYLHLQPINHVVYMESYYLNDMRYLILGWASHLDAFSVYPFHTQLLSYAIGMTTDKPSVCPSWSSRTKDSSLQISYACDR